MFSSLTFLLGALALLLGLVSGKTFSIEMKFRAKNDAEKSARLKTLHEHQVYHLKAGEPEQLAQISELISNAKGTTGSFPGDAISKSSLITAPVTFGDQTFDLTLDTGSATLWISSTNCRSLECSTHKSYNISASSTFSQMKPTLDFEIEYGSGKVSGVLGTEQISFGANIVVPKQTFGVVNDESGSSFMTSAWSGLVGLGYPSLGTFEGLNPSLSKPFFDSIMDLGLLNENAFSFWLVQSPVSVPMFFMGSPPPQYYQGQLQLFSVVDKYYWTINLHDILVDGVSLGLCQASVCKAVIDSGTSYMSAPSADLRKILSALSFGDSQVDQRCQTQSNKVITYVLDRNLTYSLAPEDYFTRNDNGSYCKVKYMALDVDPPHGPLHIFGDVFFRKFFVHFDRDHDQVGFALANKYPESETLVSLKNRIVKKLGQA